MAYHYLEIVIHRVHPMCNPPMCNIVPNMQHFFEEFVFCPVFPMCNSQKNFNSKMTKMNGNRLTMVNYGFQNDRIDLESCFLPLISKHFTVIHHKLALFSKMGKKAFIIKNFISIFTRAMSSMCNNVTNVQHFFGEFRCCTLGAPGVNLFPEKMFMIR